MSEKKTLHYPNPESFVANKKEQLQMLQETINKLAITNHMDAKIKLTTDGRAIAKIDKVSRFHLGGAETDIVNGTTLLGLLDCVNVAAAMLLVPKHRCATVELSVKFIKQVKTKNLTAIGKGIKRSGRLIFTQGEIFNTDNEICCVATGVISIIARRNIIKL